ncbi:MAG: glycosyltransferase, partial [Clostridia bacterium]|nr:glycosyltransferase [Clostridia bacterium]
MKILMITMKMDIGGAETHILELCRELKQMGHTVTLVSNGGVYADALIAEGIEHVKLPFDSKSPSSVLTATRGLSCLLRERSFDLVHAHARIPGFICSLLRRRFGFRFVTTAHLNFSVNPLWRRLSNWGERCMAVSGDIGDYLVREYGYNRDCIHLTINGIDTEKYSADTEYRSLLEEFGLPTGDERRRLVYVSRLDADRADPAYRIVRSAEQLNEQIPDLDIIIGGGGTEYAAIRRMADDVNARIGRQLITMTDNRPDVHRIAAAADVFVGVSRSALEAMAAEKPVILAGNQGSLGILDESNLAAGIETNFCCRGCPQATEETLLRDITALFAENEATRRARGAWGRQIILEQYTAARMARDYVAMYERTLAHPAPDLGNGEVIISGYYGFGNLGDDSLLACIIDNLRALDPALRITVLAHKSRAMQKQFGVRCISRINLPAIAREMKGARLLISGGGSLLQDNTSTKSLIYYLHIIR